MTNKLLNWLPFRVLSALGYVFAPAVVFGGIEPAVLPMWWYQGMIIGTCLFAALACLTRRSSGSSALTQKSLSPEEAEAIRERFRSRYGKGMEVFDVRAE